MRRLLLVIAGVALLSQGASQFAAPPVLQNFGLPLVEGWTGGLDFTLEADGSAVDLTGMAVELLLYKNDGSFVDTSGDITVTDAANGELTYFPDVGDLLASESPHRSRFKVTDGAGKVVFFPSAAMDRWLVRSP